MKVISDPYSEYSRKPLVTVRAGAGLHWTALLLHRTAVKEPTACQPAQPSLQPAGDQKIQHTQQWASLCNSVKVNLIIGNSKYFCGILSFYLTKNTEQSI